jgi:hypothetical protein
MNTKSFLKEVIARVKGDQAEVVAQKNYRKATSAINSQLATLKAKEVDDEAAVDQAKENLDNAKFPTTLISDNKYYVGDIKKQFDALEQAKETLTATRDSIKYFESLLVEFDVESLWMRLRKYSRT